MKIIAQCSIVVDTATPGSKIGHPPLRSNVEKTLMAILKNDKNVTFSIFFQKR